MSEIIRHDGIVIGKKNEMYLVKIVQAEACSGCHARAMCQSQAGTEKIVGCVPADNKDSQFETGDRVEIEITPRMGWLAVLLAYIMPFVLILISLAVLSAVGLNEWQAGLCSLAIGGVWFVVLYGFRNRIERKFDFRIRKLN